MTRNAICTDGTILIDGWPVGTYDPANGDEDDIRSALRTRGYEPTGKWRTGPCGVSAITVQDLNA